MKQLFERLLSGLLTMRGRGLGFVIGIVLGLLYLIFGFWKVIVFSGFVFLGYFLGRLWENNEDWRDVMERIMPPK